MTRKVGDGRDLKSVYKKRKLNCKKMMEKTASRTTDEGTKETRRWISKNQ